MNPFNPSEKDVILFTGNYGSGKTEVSVNVATAFATSGQDVSIVDLDLVNPYFRCREAREMMEDLGIQVIAPGGDLHNADLPILMPEVAGSLEKNSGTTILDVGGDNVGATVLAALKVAFRRIPYEMFFVLNMNRPFTDTVDGAMRLIDEIEAASRLEVTAIAGNTHLMDETDLDMVKRGADFSLEVGAKRGIDVRFVTAPEHHLVKAGIIQELNDESYLRTVEVPDISVPVLSLRRIMLPPWLGGHTPGSMATHARDNFARLSK